MHLSLIMISETDTIVIGESALKSERIKMKMGWDGDINIGIIYVTKQ